jgi:hypothetical protein
VRREVAGLIVFVVTAAAGVAHADPPAGDRPVRQLALQTNLSKSAEDALARGLQAPPRRAEPDRTAPRTEPPPPPAKAPPPPPPEPAPSSR